MALFEQMWTPEISDKIRIETQGRCVYQLGPEQTVTVDDWNRFMYVLLVMMLSPRHTMAEYWSKDEIFNCNKIKNVMSSKLFY